MRLLLWGKDLYRTYRHLHPRKPQQVFPAVFPSLPDQLLLVFQVQAESVVFDLETSLRQCATVMALSMGFLNLELALNFLCLDLEVGWSASRRREEDVAGRRVMGCCCGCVVEAALSDEHVLRSCYGSR